jgi:hypothetical protein
MSRSDMVTSSLCHMLHLMVLSCFYVISVKSTIQNSGRCFSRQSSIEIWKCPHSLKFILPQCFCFTRDMFSLGVTIRVHRQWNKVHWLLLLLHCIICTICSHPCNPEHTLIINFNHASVLPKNGDCILVNGWYTIQFALNRVEIHSYGDLLSMQ